MNALLASAALALAAPLPVPRQASDGDAWRYVVPPSGSAMRRPSLVALPLGDALPQGVTATAFDERSFRYGVLRFGDESSPRVTVALEDLGHEMYALYVDADRDLVITADERVMGTSERLWELSLPCATEDADGAIRFVPRRVAIELGRTGTILGVATLGWLEGRVRIGERELDVRRRDGDANGFFHDAADHLWVDRNGDGEWSAMEELFVVQPILPFDGERYAMRSSRLGEDLAFERIDGTGFVRIEMPNGQGGPRADVLEAQVLLVGRDGSASLVRAPGAATEVPAGDYRPTMVTLRLAATKGGDPWNYVFSERYDPTEERWRSIAKDAELVIDPIGALEFSIAKVGDFDEIETGERFRAQLRLHTADRLLVTTVYRGRAAPTFGFGSARASLTLLGAGGRRLGAATSGFA
ncbi:MAG: hypothetical protein AAGI22_04655 [Planctomycetota bacterium]